jgi:hypothetical protein
MRRSIVAAVFVASLMVVQAVWAHTDEQLDTIVSPHGGQVRAAGPYHLELLVKDGELVLHVTDHTGKEISTDRGEAKARIQHGKPGSAITVKMEPSHNNIFKGRCDSQINPETVIVVFVKLPEQDAYAARFTPLKPKSFGTQQKVVDRHDHDLDDQHKHH